MEAFCSQGDVYEMARELCGSLRIVYGPLIMEIVSSICIFVFLVVLLLLLWFCLCVLLYLNIFT